MSYYDSSHGGPKPATVIVGIVAVIAIVVGLFTLFTGFGSTSADTVGLHYNSGPFEGESFEKVIQPGSGQTFVGPLDKVIRVPANQREYTFCAETRSEDNDNGCDGGPIKVTALGGAELAFSGGVTFELNTGDEDVVKQFYEEICRKFGCAGTGGVDNDGWDEMLRVNMRGPIEDSLQEEVRGFSVDAIYAGVPAEGEGVSGDEALSTLTQVSQNLASSLKETINEYAGGSFFCGPGYDRANPSECPDFEFIITEVTPSEAVRASFDSNVASRQERIDAQNRADAKVIEANGQKAAQDALQGLYTDPGYIAYLEALALQECAKNSNCTLVVGSQAGVNVTPRQ